MRSLPGPVFAPLRLLAVSYSILFRGVPTILVIFILGFGMPALELQGVPNSDVFWAIIALTLVYTAYVAEVYKAGIESVHPSQTAAARSLGLKRSQALPIRGPPAGVRRVLPPLLNDFIGLQKDSALVGRARSDGGTCGRRRSAQASQLQLHAVRIARAGLRRHHDPAGLVRGLAHQARQTSASGRWRRMSELLRVHGLHKSFDDLEVLRGIDLEVDTHEVVGLIGASGSGKSTLIRCMNLLEPIDAGTIVIDGIDVTAPGVDKDAIRRRVGIVFQSFNLFPHMTVLANVTLAPVKVLGLSRDEANGRARDLLTRFGLDDKADEYPDRLSGGQQQRVAIVRALAMQPDLMLLDEVTSALDPVLVAEVLDVIRELAATGMTMVIATHEMGFARDVANRVCFLHEGAIVEQGPPAQMFSEPEREETRRFLDRIIAAGRM